MNQIMEKQSKVARNHFELSSYQRRLRHLRCLALRNLFWPGHKGKDLTNLQCYFTLHSDSRSPAFYMSEKIQGSLNPTWQSFDISRFEDKISTRSRLLVLKVWIGVKNKFDLLIDWNINLMGLIFFADKLQQDTVKYATNSVIFGMFDKYFIAPESTALKPETDGGSVIKVDSATVRNSYRASSVSRIYTVLRATKQTQATVNKYHRCIEDKLLSSREVSLKLSMREDLIMKRTQIRSELAWQLSRLQFEKDEIDKLRHLSRQKKEDMNERFVQLKKNQDNLLNSKKLYNQTRENFIKEEAQWKIRRKQLIGELATYVYPITENTKKECFICNVKLPDSESFQGFDDTQIAVALGYTCHMVSMMSHILDFPLRYPIDHRSSRSQITDHIHHKLTEKDNTFPLYSRGKEKFYFNYGVYLLNKDIGQLRFYCGMGTADLRTTLQNIKTLLELRLGTKLENQGRISKPNNGTREKNISDIDTYSSHASGGRLSAPDSNDLSVHENVLEESKVKSKHNDCFTMMSYINSVNTDDADSEDISFIPSVDDNFFKISNPISDKSDILFDVDSVDSDIRVTELKDLCDKGSESNQCDRTASTDYKPRTDSNLTCSSDNKSLDLESNYLKLQSQISTLSSTDYHQKHSSYKRLASMDVVDQKFSEKPQSDSSYNIVAEHSDPKNCDRNDFSFSGDISNFVCSQNISSGEKQSEKPQKVDIINTQDAFISANETRDNEAFPGVKTTFKTLSFRQTVSMAEDNVESLQYDQDSL